MSGSLVSRSLFALAIASAVPAFAGQNITFNGVASNASVAPNRYHSQITAFYCGPASIQMQLDSDQWRANLAPQFTVAQIQNQLTQNALFSVSHGASGPGWATDPNGLTTTLNAATGNVGAFVQDDDATRNVANRNIANALEISHAPVSVLINHSAHWIDVYGVVTNVAPAVDANYTIKGFLVRDPWPLAGTLGFNTYLANNARAWERYFNTAKPQASAPWSGKYVSVTDPPAPDDGLFDSDPAAFPPLPSLITDPAVAAGDAGSDTAADSDLAPLEQPGGNFSAADSQLMHYFDDPAGQGDWVVPYEDSSGVGGFELIDETTGQIDQATWFDPGSELTLPDMFSDVSLEFSGNLIDDATPEPASLGLLGLGAMALLARRRRMPIG